MADASNHWKNFFKINPLEPVAQKSEDFARSMSFIIDWQNGYDPFNAALNSQRSMVNYANLSKGSREVFGRIAPFMTFFQENLKNVTRTLVKHPERILQTLRVVPHVHGYKIKNPAEYGSAAMDFNRSPYFKDPVQKTITDPETGETKTDIYVDQMNNSGTVVEDIFRYNQILSDTYAGYYYLSKGFSEQGTEKFRSAAQGLMDSLFPLWTIPLAMMNEVAGGKIFYDEKLTDEMAMFMQEIPAGIREMVGANIDENQITGELVMKWSPVSMAVFNTLGGSRHLYNLKVINSKQADTLDKTIQLLAPFAGREFSIEDDLMSEFDAILDDSFIDEEAFAMCEDED
jgi:hypothetical protein